VNLNNPFNPATHPNCYDAHEYANDVISGRIPNCKFVVGAVKRYLRDLDNKEATFYFDADFAERYLRLVQKFPHVIGNWDTPNIVYLPWQKWVWINIMGFKNKSTNFRRFRIAHVEVPRGCGKSAMASQCSLFFLALDNPNGNMIANVATKKDQARIVLDSSRAMAQKSKAFRRETGVEVLAHTILHKKSNSMIRALSSDKNGLDGLNDVLAVCDELHAMTREVFDVIYSGMSKRKDSLTLCITTAGFSVDSVGYSQSSYAKRICEDKIDDDQFFAVVYTIDEGDDVFEESTWKKANPSYGHSVDAVTFEAKAKKAIEQPQDLPNFKVKHLNIWLSEMESFYDVDKLVKCARPITLEQFKGKKVRIGVDISSHIDLTSLGLIFFEDGNYYMFDKSYVPEASLLTKRNSLYDECVAKGYLIKTKGEAINQEYIENELKQMCKDFRVLDVCLDPWNTVKLMQDLQKDRVPTTEFRMTVANLSEPMKKMDVLIREEKIFYNGSPLLNWSFGNVVAKIDAANNVYPRKNNEKLKIDPVIAMLMALASWLQSGTSESVYNSRGLRHF
jgi:phage terminase large subunit-like protein